MHRVIQSHRRKTRKTSEGRDNVRRAAQTSQQRILELLPGVYESLAWGIPNRSCSLNLWPRDGKERVGPPERLRIVGRMEKGDQRENE